MIPVLKGLGLRAALLRVFGQGDLYDLLHEAQAQAALSQAQAASHEKQIANLQLEAACLSEALETNVTKNAALEQRLLHFDGLRGANRLIELDFPVKPRVRSGFGTPSSPHLTRLFAANEAVYAERIRSMLPFIEHAARITQHTDDPTAPHWINDWFPGFDAFSLYTTLALRRPKTLIEIGSGTSTKFARRAIKDHSLPTKIVSIDPFPRSEIDVISDEIIRRPLEDVSLDLLGGKISPGDVVFFDGSHRAFQNSDATVFFLELLPSLPADVLVGVHDIFIPDDYPPEWLSRFYSEQYLLTCWMLGGNHLKVQLPIWYCSKTDSLRSLLDPLWNASNFQGANIHGGIMWFTIGN